MHIHLAGRDCKFAGHSYGFDRLNRRNQNPQEMRGSENAADSPETSLNLMRQAREGVYVHSVDIHLKVQVAAGGYPARGTRITNHLALSYPLI